MLKITIKDERYPKQLRKIKNPPKQLYLEGNVELLNSTIFSIIGSRHGTQKGLEQAQQFAAELSMQGIVIASGMAKGIDSAAHIGTLKVGGKTIAVLGNGFNHIFPKENIGLYKKIIETGGLIISEYPPETKPLSKLFLERNRIVSGLSIGVLVVEAAYRSGTSVTAGLANEQGRNVFVLPHEIDKKYGVGTNKLIKKGAILVTSTKDIIDSFEFLTYKKVEMPRSLKICEELSKSESNSLKKSLQSEATLSCENKKKRDFSSKDHEKIYMLIERGIKDVNEIAKLSNKTISEIANVLFMLEMQGSIKKVAGGYECT